MTSSDFAQLIITRQTAFFNGKLPYYDPQFEQGKPYKKISREGSSSPGYRRFLRFSNGSEDDLRFLGNLFVQRTVHPT